MKCTLSIVNVERSNREYFVLAVILLPSQLHCLKKKRKTKKKKNDRKRKNSEKQYIRGLCIL